MGLLKSIITWWDGPTWGTRWATRSATEVGRDDQGNIYYEAGDRRWVIYNGDNEASRVPPEWHIWLHKTSKLPPTQDGYRPKTWEREWQPNPTGSEAAHAPSGDLRLGGKRPRATGDYEAWSPE